MAIVYRHIRLDTNMPFYIGIGQDEKRAYSKKNRNKHWHGVVNKHGYKVHIMMDDLTWEEACEKEREFIQLYGRKDLGLGTLVNLTDGGDGTVGYIQSEEHKAKRLDTMKGRPAHNNGKKMSKEATEKRIAARRANGNHRCSEETKAKHVIIQKVIQKVTWSNSELCEKHSAIMKAWWAERKLKTN